MIIGKLALLLFFSALVGTLKGWISQRYFTVQTTLLWTCILIMILGWLMGKTPDFSSMASMTNLHPITATIAGFIVAGALKAAGGFEAAAELLKKASQTPLGIPFSVILLVNLPIVIAMPCGRILVSALIPVALLIGRAVLNEEKDLFLPAMIMFGLTINAAASCGPSLIGGIGTLGEGMGRFLPGSFSNTQQLAIVVASVATMGMIKYVYKLNVSSLISNAEKAQTKVSSVGYVALSIFIIGLAGMVLLKPRIPLQVILMGMTVAIMMIAKLKIKDLMNQILFHPLTAMIAGFFMAGILSEYGAFDELMKLIRLIADHTPLGYLGITVIIIYLPIIFPLPCGRIIAVSMIPAVLMLGAKLSVITGNPNAKAAITVGFIMSGAASCAPSPLGGIGCIGEGTLRLKSFSAVKPQVFGVFLGVPVACLLMAKLSPHEGQAIPLWLMLLMTVVSGMITNLLLNKSFYHIGGILGGLLLGGLLFIF